jgi:hypothetical protein
LSDLKGATLVAAVTLRVPIAPLGLVAVCAQVRYDAAPGAEAKRKVLVFGGGLGFGF